MQAYKQLIKNVLAIGCTVSVYDGEEWQVKRSTDYKAIVDAVKSVEEASLKIRNAAGEVMGTAYVSAYGLLEEETIIDHTYNDFMLEHCPK